MNLLCVRVPSYHRCHFFCFRNALETHDNLIDNSGDDPSVTFRWSFGGSVQMHWKTYDNLVDNSVGDPSVTLR